MQNFSYTYKLYNNKQLHIIGCKTAETDALRFCDLLPLEEKSIIVSTCFLLEQRHLENVCIIKLLRKLYPEKTIYVLGCGVDSLKEYFTDVIFYDNKQLNSILEGKQFKKIHKVLDLKIQDGCNNNCTFCIVKKVRKVFSSTPYDLIKKSIEDALNDTSDLEVNICGIELTKYIDKKYDLDFVGLVKKILEEFPQISKLNIQMSLEPKSEQTKEIIKLASKEKRIFQPIYLAIQSCDDTVLSDMNRLHRYKDIKRLSYFGECLDVKLAWELIVGFPTETQYNFENTLKAIDTFKPVDICVFIYSSRKSTTAYDLCDNTLQEEKIDRKQQILNKSLIFKQHQHSLNQDTKTSVFSLKSLKEKYNIKDLTKKKFNINEISIDILNGIDALYFEIESDEDLIYVNIFKEFYPNLLILIKKTNKIKDIETFENQFHCVVIDE